VLIQITDSRGTEVGVNPAKVIKIRAAVFWDEPIKTVFIDYVSGGTFAKDTLKNILKLFGAHIRLAALHDAIGTPIFLNADGIASVDVSQEYKGNSVAIVSEGFQNKRVPAHNKIGLKETPLEAIRIINSATLGTQIVAARSIARRSKARPKK
jgi:hypothetical protein